MKGLRNLGNTCYLNAALQCLAHVTSVACYMKYCKNDYFYGNEKSTDILRELGILIERLWMRDDENDDAVDPWNLLARLGTASALFDGYAQQDMHEALLEIVDLAKLDTIPALRGAMTGTMEVKVTCGYCDKYQVKEEPFIGLSVPFDESIETSIQSFGESIVDDWTCDVCRNKHERTTKRLRMSQLPDILPLHVKRFRADGSKVRGHVKFGEKLELGEDIYELVAVAVHIGDVLGHGHYVARCHVGSGVWVEFDDSRCYRLPSLASVLDSEAYLLMYQRLPPRQDVRWKLMGDVRAHREKLLLDDSDEFCDLGFSNEDWVVPAVWWLRFRTFGQCEGITKAEWMCRGVLVVVDEDIALSFGALRRLDYLKLRRETAAKRGE